MLGGHDRCRVLGPLLIAGHDGRQGSGAKLSGCLMCLLQAQGCEWHTHGLSLEAPVEIPLRLAVAEQVKQHSPRVAGQCAATRR